VILRDPKSPMASTLNDDAACLVLSGPAKSLRYSCKTASVFLVPPEPGRAAAVPKVHPREAVADHCRRSGLLVTN
jgi:hypothetical protein